MSGSFHNNRGANKRPVDPIKASLVYNEAIKHQQVRLLDVDGNQIGIVSSREALYQARQEGLDLIEITNSANPPVVRIVDLNKWVYRLKQEQKQKDKKARENIVVIKEIQLRPVTDKHDIEVKQGHAREFLAENNKVKVVIKFRGREMTFRELGFEVMDKFISGLDAYKLEKSPEMVGRSISAVLAPAKKVDH